MDRNQAIGLLLSALLLVVYFQFFAPSPVPGLEEGTTEESTQTTESQPDNQSTAANPIAQSPQEAAVGDSAQQALNRQKFGAFASAMEGEAQDITLENENVVIILSSRGGNLKRVSLKKYNTYQGGPVVLLNENSSTIDRLVKTKQGDINLNDLYFSASTSSLTVAAGDTNQVVLTADLGDGSTIRQTYTLGGDSYQLGSQLAIRNSGQLLTDQTLNFAWKDDLREVEKDPEESRRRSQMNYYTAEGDLESLSSLTGEGNEEETVSEPLQWIAMKQRFFSSAIIANQPFASAQLSSQQPPEGSGIVKKMAMEVAMPLDNGTLAYRYFFGPNDQRVMDNVAPGFEDNIDFGWAIFGWIGKYVISPIFHFMERFISSYGLIIVLLVLLVKTVLFPLSYKSYVSMAKMKVLKPELDEIKEKHGDDMAAAQKEQMQLYGKVGVNPISGCVPMLLQMPILLSMFYFFPNSIELRQEPFLWTDDLSTYDSIMSLPFEIPFYGDHVSLFVILMTISQILIAWSSGQTSTVQGPMKSIQYFMPVFLMFVLNSFPSALSFYYLVSNLITFGQQTIIRRFVDDEKIHKKLQENKLRNKDKKKSKFQSRLEEAMKASQEKQQNKQRNPGNENGQTGKGKGKPGKGNTGRGKRRTEEDKKK